MRVIIQEEALRRSEGHYYHHFIQELPTIDAVPVVHGRWVYDRPNHYKCSECDAMWSGIVRFMNFCPNCGAKMDLRVIEQAPVVDAVPVVRCRECKHWSGRKDKPGEATAIGYCNHPNHHIMPLRADWFCADGEKMEGGKGDARQNQAE